MIWCRFQAGETISYGMVEDETVIEVSGIPWEEHARTGNTHKLDDVKLLVPVIPETFYCAGVNYRDHVLKMAALLNREPSFPPRADIGYRANNALIAQGETIVIPKDAHDEVQYEGELVAVFGKECRNVSPEEALDYVFGWTIGNDVSERVWQRNDRTMWRAKNADTFKPMGPWIVTGLVPDQTADYRAGQRAGHRGLRHGQHDFRCADVHQRGQQVQHHPARRHNVAGHRRRP